MAVCWREELVPHPRQRTVAAQANILVHSQGLLRVRNGNSSEVSQDLSFGATNQHRRTISEATQSPELGSTRALYVFGGMDRWIDKKLTTKTPHPRESSSNWFSVYVCWLMMWTLHRRLTTSPHEHLWCSRQAHATSCRRSQDLRLEDRQERFPRRVKQKRICGRQGWDQTLQPPQQTSRPTRRHNALCFASEGSQQCTNGDADSVVSATKTKPPLRHLTLPPPSQNLQNTASLTK